MFAVDPVITILVVRTTKQRSLALKNWWNKYKNHLSVCVCVCVSFYIYPGLCDVPCGYNAYCYNDSCYCDYGYTGDPYHNCTGELNFSYSELY